MVETCKCRGCSSNRCDAGEKGNILGIFTRSTCSNFTQRYGAKDRVESRYRGEKKKRRKRQIRKSSMDGKYCSHCSKNNR